MSEFLHIVPLITFESAAEYFGLCYTDASIAKTVESQNLTSELGIKMLCLLTGCLYITYDMLQQTF